MAYDYIETLSGSASSRYQAKLALVGLEDCPYRIIGDHWKDQPTKWPDVQYGNIYAYLIKSPGIYSMEAMENYKALTSFFLDL